MISNQYQIQPSFQGNLLKEGVKLPQKKFNEVAKIFAEKTQGMPDLTLLGYSGRDDNKFYHLTYALHSKDALKGGSKALMHTGKFKQMFRDCSPTKIAEDLANIVKEFAREKRYQELDKELDTLYGKMNNIRSQLKNITNLAEKDSLRALLKETEQAIDETEVKIEQIKHTRYNGLWDVYLG